MAGNGNGNFAAPVAYEPETVVALDLSVTEAQALRAWLLKPCKDGATALDDPGVKGVLSKVGSELDYLEAVASVRSELEQSGLASSGLSDEQVADLGRRLAQGALQRLR